MLLLVLFLSSHPYLARLLNWLMNLQRILWMVVSRGRLVLENRRQTLLDHRHILHCPYRHRNTTRLQLRRLCHSLPETFELFHSQRSFSGGQLGPVVKWLVHRLLQIWVVGPFGVIFFHLVLILRIKFCRRRHSRRW